MSILVLLARLQDRLTTAPERGASMVEYGLLLGLLVIVALVAVKAFGSGVSSQFSSINSAVN
jgi:pilus assembly protein Flp/PilA